MSADPAVSTDVAADASRPAAAAALFVAVEVGEAVGLPVGEAVGLAVGEAVALPVGEGVALSVGEAVALPVSPPDPLAVGSADDVPGEAVGSVEGDAVGDVPGLAVDGAGDAVGLADEEVAVADGDGDPMQMPRMQTSPPATGVAEALCSAPVSPTRAAASMTGSVATASSRLTRCPPTWRPARPPGSPASRCRRR